MFSGDEVNSVIHYIDKMCDLLVNETEENGQQGHCLVYLLTEDILEQLVYWCLHSGVYENKIKYELLKILENLIRYGKAILHTVVFHQTLKYYRVIKSNRY